MNWNSAPSIRVKNVSGSEIPARSFVKLNGNGGGSHFEHYVEVDQPDGTEGDYYLVTGPHAIANNKIGVAYFPFAPVKVKHSSVPSYVEEVGPASGSWQADPDGTGFAALKRDGDYSFIVLLGNGQEPTGIVLFEIDSFVYGLECEACNATVIMESCNISAGESIEVYDEAGCFFDVPEEILEGQRGFAVRMKDPSGYGGCKWVVTSLCCTEG